MTVSFIEQVTIPPIYTGMMIHHINENKFSKSKRKIVSTMGNEDGLNDKVDSIMREENLLIEYM